MGERLRKLTVEAFRGVPERWSITWPRGESLIVWGPNGTGKSTIADALEWFYSGRIEFLTREGRDRSIRHQGAPRHQRTRVAVETDGTSGGVRELAPSGGATPWGERRIADHIILRGRTLSDFVEKPKAEKFRALAVIPGLNHVDRLRADLQTVRNQLEEARDDRLADCRDAAATLRPTAGIVDEPHILAAIVNRSQKAGVPAPLALHVAIDPGWLPAHLSTTESERAVSLAGLLADARAACATTPELDGLETWNTYLAASSRATPLRVSFVRAAESYVAARPGDRECPLCGQQIDEAALATRIEGLVAELETAEAAHRAADHALRQAISGVRNRAQRLETLHERALALELTTPPVPEPIAEHLDECRRESAMTSIAAVRGYIGASTMWLDGLCHDIKVLPSTGTDAGLVELATLCEQARRWVATTKAASSAHRAAELAERLHDSCQRIENRQYRAILERISSRVSELYDALHPGEGLAGVAIEPWSDKGVELVVDFHGTRQRPPHGVLSESHLNSLAVALFLAMADLFNEHLDVIVLDDVVNSFDAEHRGRLAELLVTAFGERQLIVLTHDVQFFTHLARRAPAWSTLELTSWSFGEGPREARYTTGPMLEAARGALADDDVPGAAHKTRRAMEELLDEACEATAAALPFRRGQQNDRRELAELLSGLRGRIRSVSRPWHELLAPLLTALEADVYAALNVEVHAGRGASSATEIKAALDRLAELDGAFTCPACGTRIWHRGDAEGGRCRCGVSVYPPSVAPST